MSRVYFWSLGQRWGKVAATALVALHSLVDFSLQIPAVAIMYATILGIGYAQAFPTGGGRHNRL